jgi:hypothetical protein
LRQLIATGKPQVSAFHPFRTSKPKSGVDAKQTFAVEQAWSMLRKRRS